MNILRNSEVSLSGKLGTAIAILLIASSSAVAQKDKGKPSPPSHSAPSHSSPPAQHQSPPAQSHTSAPVTHSAPPPAATPHSNPAPMHTAPPQSQGQVTHQAPGQPSGGQMNHGGQPSGITGRQDTHTGQNPGVNGGQGSRINQPTGTAGSGQGVHTGQPNGGQGQHTNQPMGGTNGQSTRGAQPNNVNGTNGGFGNRGNGGVSNSGASNSGGQRFGSNGGGNRPAGTTVVHTRNGGDVIRGSNGNVREVRTAGGAVIHHAPDGGRRIEMSRPGGRVVVASAHGSTGYVQRPLVVNNRTYVQRTYVYHGASYARVYRPYTWGGVSFHVYTPYRYYRPAFYSYVYSPWARPISYSWGWGGSPWYGYYGGWFTPYPVYASPSLWLTDYLISRTLEDAYQARADAAAQAQAQNFGSTPMTPDVKQAIADEVRRQLDQEKADQANLQNTQGGGAPPLFSSNGPQVFVVSTALTVQSPGGDCVVTEGDVLQMNGPPQQGSQTANVVVLASKGQDCRKGSNVAVGLNDLQEMQNQMRATIDQGLGDLQSKQGQGGLPTLPPAAAAPPDNAFGNSVQPDSNASTELTQAAQEADRAEQDVVNQSLDSQGGAAPATISLGMTASEVEGIMGRPKDVANVGAKKIYVYKDMKIIFIDGKVSDVQ